MGLTTWKDAPKGKIQKFDVSVAKNYLTESEMAQLQRLVSAYLDVAEDMALRQIPMTMQDWETRLNRFIAATDREILQDAGKVTAEIARAHAESEFEKYRIVQDRLFGRHEPTKKESFNEPQNQNSFVSSCLRVSPMRKWPSPPSRPSCVFRSFEAIPPGRSKNFTRWLTRCRNAQTERTRTTSLLFPANTA
jgi:hypothetical protein